MFHVAYSGIRVIRIILFVAQIKVPPGTFICATNRIYEYPNKFSGHFVMCICVFTNKTTFRTKQIRIRRCAKEKTFAETKNGDLFICVFVYSPTKSQPNLKVTILPDAPHLSFANKHCQHNKVT